MQALSVTTFLTALLVAIIKYNYPLIDPELRVQNREPDQLKEKYDFLIIGAGSAGSVLASRLSENPNWNILLLEAGLEETFQSETPRMVFSLWHSDVDWKYTTVPQENACRASAGVCYWPRGKIVGGSSATNTMFYTRGNKNDYDRWAALGNIGWSFKEVLPYFLLSQDQTKTEYATDSRYHSTGGYLTTSDSPWQPQLARDFVDGGKDLGFEERDINGEKQTGFMMFHGTVRNGSKCSAAKAFLRPARDRPNLHMVTGALVTKIDIDPLELRTSGVTFLRKDKTYTVRVEKVILSAGTINSPQILMLSGVGPAQHLRDKGIPVIKDLPVGEGLHDHIAVLMEFKSNQSVSNSFGVYSTSDSIKNYVQNGTGPLTSGAIDALGLFSSKNDRLDYPDIGVLLLGEPLDDSQGDDIWNLFPFLVRPKSRGTLRLASTDPQAMPLMDPRYLTDESDRTALTAAVKFAINLSQTRGMRKHGAKFNENSHKACSHIKPTLSDSYVRCLVANYSMTFFILWELAEWVLSTIGERLSILGYRSKAFAASGVIDGSVMPEVVNAPTNAPIIMIAEKGAHIIKSYWKY